jgi:hypothetical protein
MPLNAAGEKESRAARRARVAAAAQDDQAKEKRMKKRLRIVKKRMRMEKREAAKAAERESACATDDALAAMPLPEPARTPTRAQAVRARPSPVVKPPFVPSMLLRGSLDLVAEQIGPYHTWPSFPNYQVKELALGQGAEFWKYGRPHLSNEERATLFAFMVENGASPELASLLLINTRALTDQAAVDHVLYLVEAHRSGSLGLKYRAYVMATRSWCYVTPPQCGFVRGERNYWAEAKKALRGYRSWVMK